MNTVSPNKIRMSVVTRIAGLFILAAVAIALFASPMLSFAANPPSQTCSGSDSPVQGPPPAKFVAAFTIKTAIKNIKAATLTPDPKFKINTPHPPTTGIELVEVNFNNKILFGVYRGGGIVMIFLDTATLDNPQFVKIS